jgi:hypothetical protein
VRQDEFAAANDRWNALDDRSKEQLLIDVIRTRGHELQMAYPDIVAIGYGLRTRHPAGRRRVRRPVFVLKFMVKRRWKRNSRLEDSVRRLPKFLLAHTHTKAGSDICAIPTDVDEHRTYRLCRPQAGPRIVAVQSNAPSVTEWGSIACVVRIPGDSRNIYALGAAHVFDLMEHFWPAIPDQTTIRDGDSNNAVARATDFAGPMRPADHGLSFDAALALISDPSGIASLLGSLRPKSAISTPLELPPTYGIATSHGLLSATKATNWMLTNDVLYYPVPGGDPIAIQHAALVESDAQVIPGDSGSPVISNDGAQFLGMNIYGGNGMSFMIPAYSLLDASNYSGLAGGQSLSLVTG